MKNKGIRLTKEVLDAALAGGTILGGGGGGDPVKGRKYAELAVEYTDLRLIMADDLESDDVLLQHLLWVLPMHLISLCSQRSSEN